MARSLIISPASETPPRASEWKRFRRVFLGRPLVTFGLIIIIIFLLVAIFAPLMAPYPPDIPNLPNSLQGPSSAHWLGTDAMGRDTLSRIIYGSRTSLEIGLTVVIISCLIGMNLGITAVGHTTLSSVLLMLLCLSP